MKKALELASRFTLPPNSLGYCGKDTAPAKFIDCVVHGKTEGVEEELNHFIVLTPYLKTIAKMTGKPMFSYEVIESYWLGNDLLKSATMKDFDNLLDNFKTQGVPNWLIEEIKANPPKKFIPFHLFQVLFVGVGRASGSVPNNLESANQCMIKWGEVTHIKGNNITVNVNLLDKHKDSYMLAQETQKLPIRKDFLPGLKVGDIVAVHWKQVIKILSPKEVSNLKYWTNQVLKILNKV